jgi:hypothetical protein
VFSVVPRRARRIEFGALIVGLFRPQCHAARQSSADLDRSATRGLRVAFA